MRPVFEAARFECGNKEATGVEVGVAFGANAEDVLRQWPQVTLTLVDNYSESPEREAEMRLRVAGRKAELLLVDSVVAARKLKDRQFDFVYIDADHTYRGVMEDLNAWFPLVKPGGVFGGDDYLNTTCAGVKKAVDEFAEKHRLALISAPNMGGGDWFVYKPA